MFKKIFVYILSVLLLVLICDKIFSVKAQVGNAVDVYFFYSEICPHCQEMKLFLAGLKRNNEAININAYEISNNVNNQALFYKMAEAYGASSDGVPMLFIGDEMVDGNYQQEVADKINSCFIKGCISPKNIMEEYKGENLRDKNLFYSDLMKLRWVFIFFAVIFSVIIGVFFIKR